MGATPELAKLVEQPFELLAEIERRSRQAHAGEGVGAMPAEWVGVGWERLYATGLKALLESAPVFIREEPS